MTPSLLARGVLLVACALALSGFVGCAPGTPSGRPGTVAVVASTEVYGDIVRAIGGDRVEVTALIDSVAKDPHSYEASARDQLRVSRAALLIDNGGGYDDFFDRLFDATQSTAPRISAVTFAPGAPAGAADAEGFNEHLWYAPDAMARVADAIVRALSTLDPAGADAYARAGEEFAAGIADIEASLAAVSAAHAGEQVFVTEPVPLYLTQAAGLVDATPAAFSEAVETGRDVPPATLLAADRVLASGAVHVLVVNAQTGGAETAHVTEQARDAGIPVVAFTELVPTGETYLTWMRANVVALAEALAR